jgi:hypothetical protein
MPPQVSQLPPLVRKARHAPSPIGRVPWNLPRFARALAAHPIETLQHIPEFVSQHLFDIAIPSVPAFRLSPDCYRPSCMTRRVTPLIFDVCLGRAGDPRLMATNGRA